MYPRPLLILVFAAILISGCGRVTRLYYLNGEFEKSDSRGLPLDQAYYAEDAGKLRGKTVNVVMADPQKTISREVSKIDKHIDDELWRAFRKDYENYLANQVWRSAIFADVSAANDASPLQKPDFIFKCAVTQWHEGNKWLRANLGLGVGRTRMQWEGAIVEAKSNSIIFAFADARINPGGPSVLGFPQKVWHGVRLIREDLEWSAQDLTKALRMVTDTTEPMRPASQQRRRFRPTVAAPEIQLHPALEMPPYHPREKKQSP